MAPGRPRSSRGACLDSDVSGRVVGEYRAVNKPRDPDYWKKWRAAHPAYRAREKIRMAARTSKDHGDRAGQYARRRARLLVANADHGTPSSAHPIMDAAELVTLRHIRPDRRSLLVDPLYEDALMTAALALCEGEDADEAVRCLLRAERALRWRSAPFLEDLL